MKRQTPKQVNFVKKSTGAAMIEFAIILPLLLLIIFGVLELGIILIQDNTLNKSVRESSRYLSSYWGLPGCYKNIAEDIIEANMNDMFTSSYSDFDGTITIEDVCINETTGVVGLAEIVNDDCTGTPNFCPADSHLHIRTSAIYAHQMIINNLMGLSFTPTLSATSIMRVQ